MANPKSMSNTCHPILVAFVWELFKGTINLPLGCFQGGYISSSRCISSRAPFQSVELKVYMRYLTDKKTHTPRTLT